MPATYIPEDSFCYSIIRQIKPLIQAMYKKEVDRIGKLSKIWEDVVVELVDLPQLLDQDAHYLKQKIDILAELFLKLKEFQNQIDQITKSTLIEKKFQEICIEIHSEILKIENFWATKYENLG